MRTDRPQGISQTNRTHPFFILLRLCAEEQQDLCEKAIRDMLFYGSIRTALTLFILFTAFKHGPIVLIFFGFFCALNIYLFLKQWHELKKLIYQNQYQKVDHMIYSNDYQMAALNNEELINMLTQMNRINGHIERIRKEFINTFVTLWIAESILIVILLIL